MTAAHDLPTQANTERRYTVTRGCEFHSAIEGSGQLNGRSARVTV